MTGDLWEMRPGREIRVLDRVPAVLVYFLYRALAALFLIWPLTSLLSSTGIGQGRDADARMFAAGGVYLLEVTRLAAVPLLEMLRSALWWLLLLTIAGLLPLAALMLALSSARPVPSSGLLSAAMRLFPRFLALSGVASLAQAAALVAASIGLIQLYSLGQGANARFLDLVALACLGVAFYLIAVLGAGLDLCRAALVRGDLTPRRALELSTAIVRARPGRLFLAFLPYSMASIGCIAAGALASRGLDVSRPGALRVGLLLLIHQGLALTQAFCRAAWLCRTLAWGDERVIREQQPKEPAGRFGDSDEPVDPSSDPGA